LVFPEVFQLHATGELKELSAQGESVTSNHLEHAEKLMKQLSGASTRTVEWRSDALWDIWNSAFRARNLPRSVFLFRLAQSQFSLPDP